MKAFALVRCLAFAAVTSTVIAAQAPVAILFKAARYHQLSPEQVVTDAFAFAGVVEPLADTPTSVTLQRPNGSEPMLLLAGMYMAGTGFPTQAAMDAGYPNGTYTISYTTAAGTTPYRIQVNSTQPQAPRVTNYAAAQAIPNGQTFTLTWAPFAEATDKDMIRLEIESDDGTFAFDTPTLMEPGMLSGSATSYTVALPPDKTFTASLIFFHLSQGDARSFQIDAPFIGGAYTETQFSLRTLPAVVTPLITKQPQSVHATAGTSVTFSASASIAGGATSYQWMRNGVPIQGATGSSYTISNVQASDMGFYSASVWNSGSTVATTDVAILTVATSGTSLVSNISARAVVPAGGDMTSGFVLRGAGSKRLLLRAVGPALADFGLDPLPDPRFDVIPSGATAAVVANDNWDGSSDLAATFASLGAFPLGSDRKSAAVVATLDGQGLRSYTMRVTGTGAGTAIAEVYDGDSAAGTSRIVNVSTRALAGQGDRALISGFSIAGTAPKRLLIRAVGPALTAYGVTGVLTDPILSIYPAGKPFVVAANDNWGGVREVSDAFTAAGAFALPSDGKDSALVVRLPPGGYTAVVSGADGGSGTALLEIYDLDP